MLAWLLGLKKQISHGIFFPPENLRSLVGSHKQYYIYTLTCYQYLISRKNASPCPDYRLTLVFRFAQASYFLSSMFQSFLITQWIWGNFLKICINFFACWSRCWCWTSINLWSTMWFKSVSHFNITISGSRWLLFATGC